uniref:HECT-type E3 ubiquitin transferase n=1 Tax=Ditylum brightwellii TaxID=49249 RepID=A0A6U3VGG6_9STRA|mmetsp:Transcript_29087/g.43260  ORF Transcript_29087/g.43260 Transcript_29087/m.43260 type:complete len:845 (+) Transcript_29087:450-2984(+)
MGSSASTSRSSTMTYPAQRAQLNRNVVQPPHAVRASAPARTTVTPPSAINRPTGVRTNSVRRLPGPAAANAPLDMSNFSRPPNSLSGGSSTVQTISAPGAYSISRNDGGATQVFRVQVPPGVVPGQEFQVQAGTRVVRVRCPPNTIPGQNLQITVPPDPVVTQHTQGMAVLTSADGAGGGGAVAMNEEVARQNMINAEVAASHNSMDSMSSTAPPPSQPNAYMVTVPANVGPGQNFPVTIEGQRMMVTCPPNAHAGMSVRIVPPPPSSPPPGVQTSTSVDRPPEQLTRPSMQHRPRSTTQMFEVIVPPGVRPNQPFSLIAAGQRVLVTCPPNAFPGQKIRFQLQVSQPISKSIEPVKLSYDNERGWTRTIRVTDMKFQWVRMDDKGDIDLNKRFDMKHSAYVRKLDFLEGNDPRMRTGKVCLVPASSSDAVVESKVMHNQKEIVSSADIATAQQKTYEEKAVWFQEICSQLSEDWNDGHIRLVVRRAHLLQDALHSVMSLGPDAFRKIWRFEFAGEPGIDAGGLAREWYQLVTEQIFDPDNGLWLTSSGNQMRMWINPASEISCPEDHLIYFRFLGRIMGKALFDQQLVAGHMDTHLYKHILGWPITFAELEAVDQEFYNSLVSLVDMEDVSMLCLDFTITEETLGTKKNIELIPNGENVEVTNDNLPEYLEANLKYRLMDRIRPQLTELLLGFFDVIPEPLLSIFDFQELELLMCGMPEIDLDDWEANTVYSGLFQDNGGDDPVCRWFWEVVRENFDQETRARLLQFVTGTAGVPSRGFSVLQGNDGNIRKFSIHGVDASQYPFPRSHTCFNRIDLPDYKSKEELHERLKIAVSTSATGFDME